MVTRMKPTDAEIVELALKHRLSSTEVGVLARSDGLMTMDDIAQKLGVSYESVTQAFVMLRRIGISHFPAARKRRGVTPATKERAEKIIQLLKEGRTLQDIGDEMILTHERVRQLAKQSGAVVKELTRTAREAERRNLREAEAAFRKQLKDEEEARLYKKFAQGITLIKKGSSYATAAKAVPCHATELHKYCITRGITQRVNAFRPRLRNDEEHKNDEA